MAKKKFFKKENAIQDGALLINQNYEDAVAALTGTEEEIEAKKKELQAIRDNAIADLSKETPEVEEAKEVRVEFVNPKGSFNFKGEVYSCADVQEAADAGDENAQALVKELVEIKSGVIQVVPVN